VANQNFISIFIFLSCLLLVLLRGENLQCGAMDGLRIYLVLAVTSCMVVCVLWYRCIYIRSYPDLTCLSLYRLRTVYPHLTDAAQLLPQITNTSHGGQDLSRGKAKDIGTINRFDRSRIRKKFLLKYAPTAGFSCHATQREQVVRDENSPTLHQNDENCVSSFHMGHHEPYTCTPYAVTRDAQLTSPHIAGLINRLSFRAYLPHQDPSTYSLDRQG
jgi:hypothetical protein